MEPLIVKISKGGWSQVSFQKIERTPFKIGRAYDNDLIIADDTVSAHHLEITQNEDSYFIENLSAENGSWIASRQIGETPENLNLPNEMTIGRTHLSFLSADTPVKATRIYARISPFSEACSSLKTALVLLGIAFFLSLFFIYPRLSMSQNWTQILVSQLSAFIVPILVATFMGFLSRIFLHSWRFPLQLSIASIGYGIFLLMDELSDFISYLFTSQATADIFDMITFMVILIVLMTWQLTAISPISTRKAFIPSLAIICTVVLVDQLQTNMARSDFSPQPSMHTVLKRHDLRLANTDSSLDSFLRNVSSDLRVGMAEEIQTPAAQAE